MSIFSNPDRRAIKTIQRFSKCNPESLRNHRNLAQALGGMAAAVSHVSQVYTREHPGSHPDHGMQVKWQKGNDSYTFQTYPLPKAQAVGIKYQMDFTSRRNQGCLEEVSIPNDRLLNGILQGFEPDDIVAICLQPGPPRRGMLMDEYRPFYVGGNTRNPEVAAEGYATILQDLSGFLLRIAE